MTYALWTVQVLLAVLFLFAGGMKFAMPVEMLTEQSVFPVSFIYFIGAMEILGAVGLILPAALRIRPVLTPLAAAGLLIIMIGAVVSTVLTMDPSFAIMPAIAAVLSAFVAYGRWQLAPQSERTARRALQLA